MSGKPIGRERNVVDGESKIERQGEGLGQGPVGNRQGNTGLGPGPGKQPGQPSQTPRPQQPQPQSRPQQPPQRPQQPAGQTPGQQQGADKGIVSDLISGALNNNNNNNNNGGIFGGGNNNNGNNGGIFGGGNNNNNGGQSVNLGGGGGGNTGGSSSSSGKGGKGKKLILLLIILVVVIVLGSCVIRSCIRKAANGISNITNNTSTNTNTNTGTSTSSLLPTGFSFNDVANNYYSTTAWEDNTGVINSNVASGVPDKLTNILGNGRDVVTVMVYLCGSDLESNYGSATSDLKEMLAAEGSSNVNVIIYTGGTTKWRNNAISSNINQIYQIKDGQLYRLESNAGDVSMTNEDTLAAFIQYCNVNFPANRNMLVLWDHGGGSVEGYAHDEKYSYTGSLTLPKLKNALAKANVDFDFIGFDACLMATVETGLALSDHCDYMIASEETEDASGWYYTNWMTALSRNTSIPTVELGKVIADDFVRVATQNSPGVGSTLSVTDLGELSTTVPSKLKSFAKKVSQMIEATDNATSGSYSTVSTSRSKAREFGDSYRIDQVDLVDFAGKLGTSESKSLAQAILSAVKYNKVSSNMSSSYGLSIYFPYANASLASQVSDIYKNIGICDEYIDCVQKYASMEMSGQYISGGGSPFNSLFGLFSNGYGQNYNSNSNVGGFDISSLFGGYDTGYDYNSGYGYDTGYGYGYDTGYGNGYGYDTGYGYDYGSGSGSDYSNILNSLFGSANGNYSTGGFDTNYNYDNYTGSYSSSDISSMLGSLLGSNLFSADRSFTKSFNSDAAAEYIAQNMFDQNALTWQKNANGDQVITLTNDQWALVDHVLLSMYLDDGTGLIDLGTDNVYDFDEEGNMIGISDGTWLSIDGNAVAYYYESTVEGADGKGNVGEDCYMITGYVPVVYNGRLAKLIVVFDSDTPYGYIAGVRFDYNSDENNYVVSKTLGSFRGASAENALYTFDSTLGTFGDFGELVDLDAEQSIAALQVGDKIQFVADYYDYDGNYLDSYVIGNWTVTKNPEIANRKPGMGTPLAMYSFTDIYNQTYWTAVME